MVAMEEEVSAAMEEVRNDVSDKAEDMTRSKSTKDAASPAPAALPPEVMDAAGNGPDRARAPPARHGRNASWASGRIPSRGGARACPRGLPARDCHCFSGELPLGILSFKEDARDAETDRQRHRRPLPARGLCFCRATKLRAVRPRAALRWHRRLCREVDISLEEAQAVLAALVLLAGEGKQNAAYALAEAPQPARARTSL